VQAVELRSTLRVRMSPRQVAEAQRLSREWYQKRDE
jgi:hypothetical protein